MSFEYNNTVSNNPFAYQTPPVYVGTRIPVIKPAPEQQAQEAAVKREQPKPQVYASTDPIDKDFVKRTFAYVPFTESPATDTYYDDSDYRGRGVYCMG